MTQGSSAQFDAKSSVFGSLGNFFSPPV